MARLTISGLHKFYGQTHAVRGVDLDIEEGEFAVLVGPSGCGKSTLLRAIAGLETADRGTIAIDGEVVNDMRPRDRNVAMVFQNYALYPYMSVYENIAFGLPRQLSGGQRQRVAIGRAVVRDARLFLFDEPLSNLDAKLRDEMRSEIKRLHQELGKTMVYVTHDQVEAMTLADRIVLLRDGRIEQEGAPLELFERPRTRFVAGFLGSPAMNFIPAVLAGGDGRIAVEIGPGLRLPVPPAHAPRLAPHLGQPAVFGIRPEHLERAREGAVRAGLASLTVTVDLIQPTGSRTYATFRLGGSEVVAELEAHDVERPGEQLTLHADMNRAILIDPATELVL
ncbi:MAG: sugar transporter, ATP-binding protein [Geminicoccaceae bacterium]|nr:sugar transporter, ATP-binding protein [Geminicoccaceae bacterium]